MQADKKYVNFYIKSKLLLTSHETLAEIDPDSRRQKEQTCQRRQPAASSAAPCVWSLRSHDSSLAGLAIYTLKYLQRVSYKQIIHQTCL